MRGDKEKKDKLAEFLTQAHLDWNNRVGKVQSQNEFASYVGVSSMAMSRFMTGGGLPNEENRDILAQKLGPKIYDICGKPRRAYDDPEFNVIMEHWPSMSQEERKALIKNLKDIREQDRERAHAPNTQAVTA